MSMTNRPAWTLSESAERTTASRSTLRRYLAAGRFPGAYKDSKGQWRFPMEDLLAVGIELRKASETSPSEQVQEENEPEPSLLTDEARLRELELALAIERERNEGLQRLVDATKQGADDLRLALRAIEAPKFSQNDPKEVEVPKRGFWSALFGG